MPMPGSQRMNSIAVAYFLFRWRWILRAALVILTVYAYVKSDWKRKWLPVIPVVLIAPIIYFLNFKMSADHMFRQPNCLVFKAGADNTVDTDRLVIGVVVNNEAKAYPIRFLGFHHMVRDTVGGKPVLVTYCTVCRTGRAFDPVVNGSPEIFRLVGMDHFNAMFEDATTGSWWRQATGEAVAGKMKGMRLTELFSSQASLADWLRLHPSSLIMQEDTTLNDNYTKSFDYESGKSRSTLTGTDTASWHDKSWVIGIAAGELVKAYDWNLLRSKGLIQDDENGHHVLLVLAGDNKSFFAFDLPDEGAVTLQGDMISYGGHKYRIDGTGTDTTYRLRSLPAYQEFWHSWRTFHPATKIFK